LNADINAAINIVRKVAPNSFSFDIKDKTKTKWSRGEIISPKRLRIVNFQRLNKKILYVRTK